MIDQDVLHHSIVEATSDVFSTMLDMSVRCTGPAKDNQAGASGVVALVGITGDWGGSGVFCCSPAFAGVISARMLGDNPEPASTVISEEILDVVAEVANMMVGNIKNGLEPVTGPLAISVPTVIHGRNFQFRSGTGLQLQGAAVGFEAENEHFEVRISLAPTAELAGARARIPVLGLVHVNG